MSDVANRQRQNVVSKSEDTSVQGGCCDRSGSLEGLIVDLRSVKYLI